MKKAILMMFVLGFVSMNGYAQKVYKRDGKVYLECTVASRMPAGSVTTTPKCKDGAASNTTFRNGATDKDMNIYASENDQVFEKLEIDASDMAEPDASAFTMDWVTAYNGCKSKGEGWRLPTQRELILMYIFRVPLVSMIGKNFDSSGYYWSSFEYGNGSSCWSVGFDYGGTNPDRKSDLMNRVRCVREAAL